MHLETRAPIHRSASANDDVESSSSSMIGVVRKWCGLEEPTGSAFPLLVGQLGLVVLALWRFRIEESYGLPRLLPLIFFGFVAHHLLPARFRRSFFLLLSIAAIGLVLPFPHSLILVALGLGLIGICHLPIPFGARVALVLLVGAGLAVVRAGWVQAAGLSDLQQVVVPVAGAMFMFRLAIYLYDLRNDKKPATIAERLSYFFLLPNVTFLLFPVVDYQTYRRTYYNAHPHVIYQKGILWMMRGLTHLLLYRVVYLYLTPAPGDVQNAVTVMQFAVTSYLLYLRISGQFHLIVGILCLFGLNLPETHHQYFLAAGFNDFWRRINIYWKDFMMKMVYYPAFVRLHRRTGMTGGIVLSTVTVFVGTWLLHSYQWFWLRGSFPITATDTLFWGFLGIMVIFNSLREARRKKKELSVVSASMAAIRATKTVGFFVLMSLLWSLWSTPTISGWLNVVSNAGRSSVWDFVWLVAVMAAAIAIGTAIQLVLQSRVRNSAATPASLLRHPAVQVTAVASLLLFISLPYVRSAFGYESRSVILSLGRERLNAADQETADRGYYEGLLDHRHFASALWSARGDVLDDGVAIEDSNIAEKRNDLLEYELKPSFTGSFKNAPFVTNQWRMRGRDYQQPKPSGTFRIALVGASYEMAGGVNNDETFSALLEERLNGIDRTAASSQFEVLNFSVGGYSMIHKAMVAENRIVPFDPDLVLLTVYSTEEDRLMSHLVRIVERGVPIPYPSLRDIVARSGAKSWMENRELREKLRPYVYDILEWSLAKIKADCEKRGFRLALLLMPTTTDAGSRSAEDRLTMIANRASKTGLEPLRSENVYGEYEMSDLQLTLKDSHLNVLGNRLVADKLLQILREPEHRLLAAKDSPNGVLISQ